VRSENKFIQNVLNDLKEVRPSKRNLTLLSPVGLTKNRVARFVKIFRIVHDTSV
jgi:hypothetical protein